MSVYKAINAVQAELARTGIAKLHRNEQGQGYDFRGIDDIYNALAPLLAKNGLCILPRTVSRQCDVRTSSKGSILYYVVVEVEFDFVCSEDGSKHTVKTFGEAMDSGDKATNKSMSAAYKYACFQAFCIPLEGMDADETTHELPECPPDLLLKAETAAAGGLDDYGKFWQGINKDERRSLAAAHHSLKERAARISTPGAA